ncbi:hypothetical protein TNCV_1767901 [Trichonephila clavipes]|nr:hypothetical protein TNCV_1767901 [Trichonephila clavipes]
MRRVGHIVLLPRSPNLNSLGFFCCGHSKSLVYERPVARVEDLTARIAVAFADQTGLKASVGVGCAYDLRGGNFK